MFLIRLFKQLLRPIASTNMTALTAIPSRSKIYTRTGDQGTTALYTGERLTKSALTFHALGTVDELNSNIGHAIAHCQESHIAEKYIDQLKQIQSCLFDIGAHVATPRTSGDEEKMSQTRFSPQHTDDLEKWIDEITTQLEPLRTFVLPSGGVAATALHLSRSVCRRCERVLTELLQDKKIDPAVYKFVNRLSDYLFTLARYAAKKTGNVEEKWQKSNI